LETLTVRFLASHLWFWVLLLVPALAVAFWAYYRILAPLQRPARLVLWGLRAGAFALVLLALWQPILTAQTREGGKPVLAVLLDRSASMRLPAGGPDGARTRDAELVEVRRRLTQSLAGRFRLDEFAFNERLTPLSPDSLPPASGGTALGQALEEALTGSEARPVSGLLVVSDGVNTVGRDPVRVAGASGVPIFTVALGPDGPVRDAEIRSVRSNPTAFLGEPLPVRAVLSSWELGGRSVRLEVRQQDRVLASQEVPLIGERGVEQEVMLEVRPTTPGLNLYDVRLSGWTDSIPQNDRRLLAVEVLERRTRVLVVSGRLDWDYAFLRRTLAADTTLEYTFLVQVRPGVYAAGGEARLRRLPESTAELREFAAVVIAGTEERGLPAATLSAIGRFVREGGGLLLLGGPTRPNAWTSTGEFGAVLPASLAPERAGGRVLPVNLTIEGQAHPATAIRDNPAEAAREWGLLPPVECPGSALTPRPDAKTLLEFRLPRGAGAPALAVAFSERGKSAWLYARGVWRWDFVAAGSTAPTDLFPQFCLSLVRWLAEPAVRERFQADPTKRVFQNGEPIAFHASLWNEAYAPVTGATVAVDVRGDGAPDSPTRRLDLRPGTEAGGYDGEQAALPPGAYAYTATAVSADGRPLGGGEGRFWVEEMGPEFGRSRADREGLAQMAGRSGGAFAEASDLAPLLERIPQTVRRVGRLHEWELWNHWLLFVAFVTVLSVEWFLRRRRGLA
jgi:hypothetical protein